MNENKNNSPFSEIIKRLAHEKGISEEKIKNLVVKSFTQLYEQKLNQTAVNLHFEFGDELQIYRLYQIVDQVNDPEKQIASTDLRLKEGKKQDNTFFLPLQITDSSWNFISEIKKKVWAGLKEINWENQFKLLQKLQQEEKLVRGHVQGQKGDYYLVNLILEEGKVIGFWEKKEWSSVKESPRLGQSFQFLIKEVNESQTKKWPPLLLTRAGEAFILQVLKLEVPELKEGSIAVQKISCSPELIKLVMESKKKGVDSMGACLGREAVRIKSISRALFPARVEILSQNREKETSASSEPKEIGNYKNIQVRTSVEGNQKNLPWNKKFNLNK